MNGGRAARQALRVCSSLSVIGALLLALAPAHYASDRKAPCDAGIAGVWKGTLREEDMIHDVTLTLMKGKAAGQIEGTLTSLAYSPGLNPVRPPGRCTAPELIVRNHSRGNGIFNGRAFEFETNELLKEDLICVDPDRSLGGYAYDKFTGTLDPNTCVLTLIWNDDTYVHNRVFDLRKQ